MCRIFGKVLFIVCASATISGLSIWFTPSFAANPVSDEIKNLTTAPTPAALTEESAPERNWLSTFYADHDMRPLWVGSRKADRRLATYLKALASASNYGVDPEDYGYSSIKAETNTHDPADAAALDLMVSRSFVNFALDIRDGVVSPRMDFTEEELEGRELGRKELLEAFAKRPNVNQYISELRRDNPVQRRLTSALQRYRNLAENGGWQTVALNADKFEIGDSGDGVILIADRLRAEGFFHGRVAVTDPENENANPAPLYDEKLAAAVERFQRSRGIEPDGIVGPNTLARMNETPQELIEKIRLNLERARWLPQDFDGRYVLVNIARFSAGLYENDILQKEIRTVVGKYHQQTPVFAGSMSYVVVNPYWNIPESILRGEIAPKMAEDPDYLAEKNMEVVDGWSNDPSVIDPATIDWDNLPARLDFRVRQKPGPQNSLGYIKFMFPNDYSVYLHDTPADSLFGETKRAFSHGCIRLEDPFGMAEWVLRNTKDVDRQKVERMIAEKAGETVITLDEEIPVYISYFTAWAEQDGDVYFLDDLYKRDSELKTALERSQQSYEIPAEAP